MEPRDGSSVPLFGTPGRFQSSIFATIFSEKWNKEADELFLEGAINTLLLTDPCVLRDKDCDFIKNEHPVLVCSPTKVGSMTIEYSLKAIGVPTRHLHAIRGEKIINTILEQDDG